jgi:hypothetical protein
VLDRADNEFDAETEDDQVEDHLGRDDQASRLAGRGNIPEADRGKTVTVK